MDAATGLIPVPGLSPQPPEPPPASIFNAEEFVRLLAGNLPLPREAYEVRGEMVCRGQEFARLVEVHDAVFHDPVDLSSTRFKRGLDLSGCRFRGGLTLANACVDGALLLDGAVFGAPADLPPDLALMRAIDARLTEGRRRVRGYRPLTAAERLRRLQLRRRRASQHRLRTRIAAAAKAQSAEQVTVADLTNLRVRGALSLMAAQVFGRFACAHADVEDDLRIDGARFGGDVVLRRSSLGELRTDGRAGAPPTRWSGLADAPCLVTGILDLTSARVQGDVRVIGASVRGESRLQAAEVHGNVLCRAAARWRTRLGAGAWFPGLQARGTVVLTGTRIQGDLNLRIAQIGGTLEARAGAWRFDVDGDVFVEDARVTAAADLRSARVRGRTMFTGAHVGAQVDLSGADLRGEVSLQGTSVGATLFCRAEEVGGRGVPCRIADRLWLLGTSIGGDLDLSGADVADELVLQNARIGQNLIARVMNGCRTRLGKEARLNGVKVTGAVIFSGASLEASAFFDDAQIGSSLSFEASRAEPGTEEPGTPCEIAQQLWMIGAAIGGNVSMSGASVGAELIMQSASVGHDLTLDGKAGVATVVGGDALLEGVRISGEMRLAGATVEKDLILEQASIGGTLGIVFDVLERAGWPVEPCRLGNVRASSISVGKDVVVMGARIGRTDPESPVPDPREGADFSDARIGGKFQLHKPDEGMESLRTRKAGIGVRKPDAAAERAVLAAAALERTHIQGDLRLARAEVKGDLVLYAAHISRDLDLRNARVGANVLCRSEPGRPKGRPLRASVRGAMLETVEISGDAELAALDVAGDLVFRDARIRGRLQLLPSDSAAADGGARVGGIIDLDAAEVAHAVLSGANVDPPPVAADDGRREQGPWHRRPRRWAMRVLRGGDPEPPETGRPAPGAIVLERATLRKLELRTPLPPRST